MCRQQHGRGQAGEEAGCQASAGPHVGACSVAEGLWCSKRYGDPASSQWHRSMLKGKACTAAGILLTPRGQGVSRQPLARAAELSGHRIRRVAARAACRCTTWWPHVVPACGPTNRAHARTHTPSQTKRRRNTDNSQCKRKMLEPAGVPAGVAENRTCKLALPTPLTAAPRHTSRLAGEMEKSRCAGAPRKPTFYEGML